MSKKNIYNAITESFDTIGYNEGDYFVEVSSGNKNQKKQKIHITIREKNAGYHAMLLLDILHEADWRIQEIELIYNSLAWNHQVYTSFLNSLYNIEYIYI